MGQRMTSTQDMDSHLREGGPFFDDLRVGQRVDSLGVTLTTGLAAAHAAIVGNRMPMSLDRSLSQRVTGVEGQLADPTLVWNVAIGQSTHFTARAKANLFYRDLVLRRLPRLGDTLYTSSEVVALKQNSTRTRRYPTGMFVLRIRTMDQNQRVVLDFTRCAMLPLSSEDCVTGHVDDLSSLGSGYDLDSIAPLVAGWSTNQLPKRPPVRIGQHWSVVAGDVVTSAPELARLTLNLAAVHHDYRAHGEQRLVYGGHTVGLAATQLYRTVPSVLAIVGWRNCDHLAPVHEGDTLAAEFTIDSMEPLVDGVDAADIEVIVRKIGTNELPTDVLRWRLTALARGTAVGGRGRTGDWLVMEQGVA